MEIEATSADRNLLLEMKGELDHHGARNALRELELSIDAALPKKLVLDLAGVTFMDSSGIALILRAQQRMQLLDGSLLVRNVPQQARRVLDAAGIKTSDWFCVRKGEVPSLLDLEVKIAVKLGGFPVFVKPCNAGSSVGVSKVKTSDDLEEAMMLAFQHDQKILIERAMVGKEVEVAVMGNDSPEASVHVGEIVPKLEFYDYNSKYYDDTADLYLPARISDEETQLIRQTAVKAFKALGCRGLARVDFFLLPDGSCVLNEPNTLPGFTKISMYPKLFIDSGLSYPEIIDRLITLAIKAQ